MTFTPGPWRRTAGVSAGGWAQYQVESPDYGRICETLGSTSEEEANARLIAAAVDLLEALEEARSIIAATHYMDPILNRLDAAIAKAKGEES